MALKIARRRRKIFGDFSSLLCLEKQFCLRNPSPLEVKTLKIFRLRRAFPPRWEGKPLKIFACGDLPPQVGGNDFYFPPRGPLHGGEVDPKNFLAPAAG